MKTDPLHLRRNTSEAEIPVKSYEFFYRVCISIPILISFSLVFFMMFYISPRGESLQHFQRQIFNWNKNRMAEHMEHLGFRYKIVPYVANSQAQGSELTNSKEQELIELEDDRSVVTQKLEDTVVSIYYYDRSYFKAGQVAERVLPTV